MVDPIDYDQVDPYVYTEKHYEEDGVFAAVWDYLDHDQVVKLVYNEACSMHTVIQLTGPSMPVKDMIIDGRKTDCYKVLRNTPSDTMYLIAKDFLTHSQMIRLAYNKLDTEEQKTLMRDIMLKITQVGEEENMNNFCEGHYGEDGVLALAWDCLPRAQIMKLIYNDYCALSTVLELSTPETSTAEAEITSGRLTELYKTGIEKFSRGEITGSDVYLIAKDYLDKTQAMWLARNKLKNKQRLALVHTIVNYLTGK